MGEKRSQVEEHREVARLSLTAGLGAATGWAGIGIAAQTFSHLIPAHFPLWAGVLFFMVFLFGLGLPILAGMQTWYLAMYTYRYGSAWSTCWLVLLSGALHLLPIGMIGASMLHGSSVMFHFLWKLILLCSLAVALPLWRRWPFRRPYPWLRVGRNGEA